VAFAWWCAAAALTVVSAALFRYEIARLVAANPAARLQWLGWPAKVPRGTKALGIFSTLAGVIAMNCVFDALGRRHQYDILWGLPLVLFVVVMGVVPQVQHNRRLRRAA
jgi:hypothetical protein